MKTPRAYLILIAALAFTASALPTPPAQAGPLRGLLGGHKQAKGGRMQAALEKLNLSSDQKAKIKPIMESLNKQMQDIKGDRSLNMDQKKAKGKDVAMMAFMQIRPILTPAQQDQLMKMFQQARAKKNGA